MTEEGLQQGGATGGLLAAFDWRAGRTWGVFLGSALATGFVAAAVAYFVSVAWLGLPSAAVSSGDAWKAALLGALVFAAIILLMGGLATRGLGPRKGSSTTATASIAGRAALWLDLAGHLLWLVVFILPSVAMQALLFGLPDTTGAGEVTWLICLMGLVLGPIFLLDLLRRWGCRKVERHA